MKSFLSKITLPLLLTGFGAQTLWAQVPVTNNLLLWLKADALALANGTPVSSWTDSSPSANHATQGTAANQPTFVTGAINGKPVVSFDGVNDFLALTRGSLTNGLTYITVFRTTSADATSTFAGNAPLNLIGDHTVSVYNGFGLSNGLSLYKGYDGGWLPVNGAKTLNDNAAHVLSATHGKNVPGGMAAGPGTARLFADGTQEVSGSIGYYPGYAGFDRIAGGYLNSSGTADFFSGDVAEVLIYDTVLSNSDRFWVENYLGDKYNIAVPEPTTASLLALAACAMLRRRRQE